MLLSLLALVLATQAAPALPQLNAMQQGALTCSAAFALDARTNGDAARRLREREFFVRALARIMDETGATREAVAQMAGSEAQRLAGQPEQLAKVLPACRSLLDAPPAG